MTEPSEADEKHIKLLGESFDRLYDLMNHVKSPEDRAAARAKLQEAVGIALREMSE